MRKINPKKMTELENYILELSCIAYLQSVIQCDNYIFDDDLSEMYEEAKSFLVEKEVEAVAKLKEMFYSKDFAVSIE
ncbi:MAG: hypothetical protein IJY79_03480 [Clostridia bacterium]|nr:hypothetical protein [Clostridia bacterium]